MFTTDYYLDVDWLQKISYKLPLFKRVPGKNNFACRCVFCGDSKRSSRTTRLYFYTKKDNLNFECKNCGESGSFWNFMKAQVAESFDEYKKEQALIHFKKNGRNEKPTKKKETKEVKLDVTTEDLTLEKSCVNILSLSDTHPALQYMRSRHFDDDMLSDILYTDNFLEATKELAPDKELSKGFPNDPRIIIPFYDENNILTMFQGRSLDKNSSLRYLTIKRAEDDEKIFGLNKIDRTKTVYCVEGPLDSLFIDNCIAACDSALTKAKADVFCWDNQCRSHEIVDLMEKAIANGKSVVIWDKSTINKTDINDMIKEGMTRKQLNKLIKERTFSGLKAKLEFNNWKKV